MKRTDADEVFHVLAWDAHQLRRALEPYASRLATPDLDCLLRDGPSLFANGRQVCAVTLRGGQS